MSFPPRNPEHGPKVRTPEEPVDDPDAAFYMQFGNSDPTNIVAIAESLAIGRTPPVHEQAYAATSTPDKDVSVVERALTDTDIDEVVKSVADNTQHMREIDDRVGIMGQRLDNIDDTNTIATKEITNLRADLSAMKDEISRMKNRLSVDIDTLASDLGNQISALRLLITKHVTKTSREEKKPSDDREVPDPSHRPRNGDEDRMSEGGPIDRDGGADELMETSRVEQEALFDLLGQKKHRELQGSIASTSRVQLEAFASRPLTTAGRALAAVNAPEVAVSEYDSWDLE